MDVDQVRESQLRNIENATGTSRDAWFARIEERRATGARHAQLVQWLKTEHGLSHGNANALVQGAARATTPATDLVDEQYSGGKAGLRPVYDALVDAARQFGDDVEVAPKKTGVSLRRRKQFAVVTPATRTRIDLGLNLRGVEPNGRLEAAGGMCTHRVRLESVTDLDDDVRRWLREAYERA